MVKTSTVALLGVAGLAMCCSSSMSSFVASKKAASSSAQGAVSTVVSSVVAIATDAVKDVGSTAVGGVKNAAKAAEKSVASGVAKTASDAKKAAAGAKKANLTTPTKGTKTQANPVQKPAVPASGGVAGFTFSPATALAELNKRRAGDGLAPMTIDPVLMKGAQSRADIGSFPHDDLSYQQAGAFESLSAECEGSGDDVIRWSLTKLWDFEKENKQNATAPGSPCFAIIPSDQGHYRNFGGGGGPKVTKVGVGLAPLKKINGGTPPAHMTHLVVWWMKK